MITSGLDVKHMKQIFGSKADVNIKYEVNIFFWFFQAIFIRIALLLSSISETTSLDNISRAEAERVKNVGRKKAQ